MQNFLRIVSTLLGISSLVVVPITIYKHGYQGLFALFPLLPGVLFLVYGIGGEKVLSKTFPRYIQPVINKENLVGLDEDVSLEKNHDIIFIAFMVFLIGINLYLFYIYYSKSGLVLAKLPDASIYSVAILSVLALLNIICLVGIYLWKKWGPALFLFSTIVSTILLWSDGIKLHIAIQSLIVSLVLLSMIRKKVSQFT